MPRKSLITQMAWVMMTVIVVGIMLATVTTGRIFVSAFQRMVVSDMQSILEVGEALLTSYARGTRSAAEVERLLNPEVRVGDWQIVLEDAQGELVAMSSGADHFIEEVHRNANMQATVDGAEAFFRQMTGGRLENVFTRTVTVDGRMAGQVTVGRQVAVLNDLTYEATGKMASLLAGLLALFCVFSWLMGRWVVMPVRRLTRASHAIAAGDYSVRADEHAPGEMGQLSAAFNLMSGELQHTVELLAYEKRSMVQVLEGLSEGILALDADGHIIHRNAAFDHLLPAVLPEGAALEARVHTLLRKCLASGHEQHDTLWRGEVCLEAAVSPIPVRSGAAYGAVALVRDITTQQRLEQTRHDYVANITHELRTPLATMRGLMEPLKDGLVEDEHDRNRYYAIILGEILRLSRLVNDLLELSGLQSGRASIEMEDVETPQLFDELQDRFAKAYRERGVTLTLAMPEADCRVRANEDRLAQVLTILLDNALKYTPQGGTVRLTAAPQDGKLRISVCDTGTGISPEHLAHVFDRFYQTDSSHSEKGNGLGLSIAQEVMGKMGLRLQVTSALGAGSSFFFDVPLCG